MLGGVAVVAVLGAGLMAGLLRNRRCRHAVVKVRESAYLGVMLDAGHPQLEDPAMWRVREMADNIPMSVSDIITMEK